MRPFQIGHGPVAEAMLDKDDPKCELRLGETVVKTVQAPSDMTKMGTKGRICGSFHVDGGDCYLVHWEGNPEEVIVFIVNEKGKPKRVRSLGN